MKPILRTAIVLAVLGLLAATPGRAQLAFTPGDLVVYRVGNGSETLANAGNSVFLDEYNVTGTLVQSIALNNGTNGGGGNDLVASGTGTSEGQIGLSPNGQYLAVTGYDTTPGGYLVGGTPASLSTSPSATINRTVDIFDASGTTVSSTALNDFADANNPRGAIPTSTGSNFYVTGGSGGVRYGTAGTTTSIQLSTTNVNLRGVTIAGGQLYVSTQSGTGGFGVGSVGTGTPTTSGQTITGLMGLPNQAAKTFAPNQFAFADLNSTVAGVDTLYIADEGSTAGGVIDKFSLVGGIWTANGTIAAPTVRGLTLSVANNGTVNLYGTTGGTLYGYADTTGYNVAVTAGATATTLATAATNESFRGIAFVPTVVPEPSTWAMIGLGMGGIVTLRRVGRRTA